MDVAGPSRTEDEFAVERGNREGANMSCRVELEDFLIAVRDEDYGVAHAYSTQHQMIMIRPMIIAFAEHV